MVELKDIEEGIEEDKQIIEYTKKSKGFEGSYL